MREPGSVEDSGGFVRRPLVYIPFRFGFFVVALVFLLLLPILVLGLGAVLGLSAGVTVAVFLAIVLGSAVNIPLIEIESRIVIPPSPEGNLVMTWTRWWPSIVERKKTLVALNVGGGLVPFAVSVYFLSTMPLPVVGAALLASLAVTAVTHRAASLVPGLGIALPPFVPAVSSVLVSAVFLHAWVGSFEHLAPVTFTAGVLGVLVGADLLNLPKVGRLGARLVSIGGAGTFDGIFITGIFGTLLAGLLLL